MTRYHVLVSDELIRQLDPARLPAGFRFVEQEPTDPERYPGMHWWLAEDDEAGPEFEGKRVEPTFTRGQVTEDGPYVNEITDRRVVA